MKMGWVIGAAILASVAGAIPAAVMAAGTVPAPTTPTAFSAGFSTVPNSTELVSFREADGNALVTVTDEVQFTGAFAGFSAEQISIVVHPDGSMEFHGSDLCNCTVAGSSGTITMLFSGNGAPDGSTIGYISMGHGTGGLANLHGTATFLSSDGGTGGTWSGVYHFAP